MKPCGACQQMNPDEALFCQQCGTRFADSGAAAVAPQDQTRAWRAFIGPNADRYLEQFGKFTDSAGNPRFALTWHWPAFLVDPFLWFLYRKMYLYALVYAIGPVISAYLTGDLSVGIVWRVVAGASANYIYYWHVKEQLAEIHRLAGTDATAEERLIDDAGGVQPYVIWLGVVLHALMFAILIAMILQGPPEEGKGSGRTPLPRMESE